MAGLQDVVQQDADPGHGRSLHAEHRKAGNASNAKQRRIAQLTGVADRPGQRGAEQHQTYRPVATQPRPVHARGLGRKGRRRVDSALVDVGHSAAASSGGRYLSRIVTSSSDTVGWSAQVASHCALVRPAFTAMAASWIVSGPSSPTI
jgi:hypothetical protein